MQINYQPKTINCSRILKKNKKTTHTRGTYSQPQGKIYKPKALADIKEKKSNQQNQPKNTTFRETSLHSEVTQSKFNASENNKCKIKRLKDLPL